MNDAPPPPSDSALVCARIARVALGEINDMTL